jgi:DNA polymerase/3'-5' exonuclease PolX
MTDFRDRIITELEVLRRTSKSEESGAFKSRSYATAIKALREVPAVFSIDDVPPIRGVGEKIKAKIAEIIATGHLASADKARATKAPDTLELFENIYGVGPKKATELVKAGYRTLDSLRLSEGVLNKKQLVGLKYYDDLLERIPRSEMQAHEHLLITNKPVPTWGFLVGSYRRGAADSGDIDMIVSDSLPAFVERLQAIGYIKEVLALGESKCMAIAALPGKKARRLDLLVSPPEEFAFAMLYFTGSDGFNIAMRARAVSRGLTLNEHGIAFIKSGKNIRGVRTERDIFTILKMVWKEPEERTGPAAVIPV